MPSRLRGDCVRDWCSVWNQEWIHTHARDGFKRRGLINCLSGDDDEELRGTAGQIWRGLDIPAKRKIAVADVERAFNAKELRWDYHFIYGEVLREFPKRGQLDEMLDGHDVADAIGDNEDASSEIDEANMDSGDEGDDDSGGQAAEICRQRLVDLRKNTIDCKILADLEQGVRAGGEEGLLETQPAVRTVAILDSLLETAKDLPTMSDPVRRQLEYSKALAERQLRKRKLNSAEVDACVKSFADKRAERNAEIGRTMQSLRDLTKKSEEAKASALAAKEELQKIKAEEMEEKRKEREQVQASSPRDSLMRKCVASDESLVATRASRKLASISWRGSKRNSHLCRSIWSRTGFHFANDGITSKVGMLATTGKPTAAISRRRWRG